MTETGLSSDRLPLLDGLRGVAALAVLLYHITLMAGPSGPFSRGYLFVDLFFLLSGFVLALSAEPQMKAGLRPLHFLRRRIGRLWPMIATGAVMGAAVSAMTEAPADLASLLVLALLMIPALWLHGEMYPLNGPQWSLMLEILANTAHAFVLRRLGDRTLLGVVIVSGVALAAVILAFGSNTLGPYSATWWYALPRVAFAYTLGVWMARRCRQRRARTTASWQLMLVLPITIVVALSGLPLPVAWGDTVTVLIVFPALFWITTGCAVPSSAEPWLRRLGAFSFPLYAIHVPVILMFDFMGEGLSFQVAATATALIAAHALADLLEAKRTRTGKQDHLPKPA